MIEVMLAGVAILAVMVVFWEGEGTAIAVDTCDPELMESSWSGMLVAMTIALVAFVLLLVAALGGAA